MADMEYANEWLEYAQRDYDFAVDVEGHFWPKHMEKICYNCQQATEKALKAVLAYQEIDPPYTHDLTLLCQLCIEFDESFSAFLDDCEDMTRYAARTRYPDDIEITEDETKKVIERAYEVYHFVFNLIPELNPELRFDEPDEISDQGPTMKL
jgi:HEPN domain-containing protein